MTFPQVCEYAINMTSREHIVPIAARKLILQTWVMSKQMAQQQISKTFGTDDEVRKKRTFSRLHCLSFFFFPQHLSFNAAAEKVYYEKNGYLLTWSELDMSVI